MSTRTFARLFCILALAALAGCAEKEAKWSGDAARFAVYATQIPLYPGAKIEDVMGSTSWGDDPNSESQGMAWWYSVKDPREKVVAWYEARVPQATRSVGDDGSTIFTLPPRGGEAGEDMGVAVEDGKIRVFEHTKPGKRKVV
jgi:hypothetical protein